jgi:hypothetical protein
MQLGILYTDTEIKLIYNKKKDKIFTLMCLKNHYEHILVAFPQQLFTKFCTVFLKKGYVHSLTRHFTQLSITHIHSVN